MKDETELTEIKYSREGDLIPLGLFSIIQFINVSTFLFLHHHKTSFVAWDGAFNHH